MSEINAVEQFLLLIGRADNLNRNFIRYIAHGLHLPRRSEDEHRKNQLVVLDTCCTRLTEQIEKFRNSLGEDK